MSPLVVAELFLFPAERRRSLLHSAEDSTGHSPTLSIPVWPVESLMQHCRALSAEIEHTRTHATHLLQAVLKEAFAPAAQ